MYLKNKGKGIMTIHFEPGLDHPGAARPGVEAPTTTPGEQETRENNGITERRKRARIPRKKLFMVLGALAGVLGAGAIGAGVEALKPDKGVTTTATPGSEGLAGGVEPTPYRLVLPKGERVEGSRGVFDKELELKDVLDAGAPDPSEYSTDRTPQEALAALSENIQYAINLGGADGEKLLQESFNPNYSMGSLKPTELLARMDFVNQNRADATKNGLLDDYYAYGFNLEAVSGKDIGTPDAGSVTVLAKLRIGDYRPYENDAIKFEPPTEQLVAVKLSSQFNLVMGGQNKNGGWAISNIRPVVKENGQYKPVYDNNSEKSGLPELPAEYRENPSSNRYDLQPPY